MHNSLVVCTSGLVQALEGEEWTDHVEELAVRAPHDASIVERMVA